VRLHLLGVRGSTPAAGSQFVRYGGHTSCVAISADGAERPTLVLDAGTGLRALTAELGGAAYQGSILLSHLHWDHMQGLPFCQAGDRDDARVDLYLPDQPGTSAHDLLARSMSPPSFPITPDGLKGTWTFTGLEPGKVDVEGFAVTAADAAHKGGRTFGYRVADDRGAIAYLPDHAPAAGVSDELASLLHGVDVLLHDAQFVERERKIADDYGHATVQDAIDLAVAVAARRLVLFHHGPARTDDALDEIAASYADAPVELLMAREGDRIDV
jgi:phosphoribosyl 1,2-cyclic phosphodiesterase